MSTMDLFTTSSPASGNEPGRKMAVRMNKTHPVGEKSNPWEGSEGSWGQNTLRGNLNRSVGRKNSPCENFTVPFDGDRAGAALPPSSAHFGHGLKDRLLVGGEGGPGRHRRCLGLAVRMRRGEIWTVAGGKD